MKPSSQNYDGGLPSVPKKRLTLDGSAAAVLPSRGKHPMHGIGAQVLLRYCACGGMKDHRTGMCKRGCSA